MQRCVFGKFQTLLPFSRLSRTHARWPFRRWINLRRANFRPSCTLILIERSQVLGCVIEYHLEGGRGWFFSPSLFSNSDVSALRRKKRQIEYKVPLGPIMILWEVLNKTNWTIFPKMEKAGKTIRAKINKNGLRYLAMDRVVLHFFCCLFKRNDCH